jgi:molecular chaperone DnaK
MVKDFIDRSIELVKQTLAEAKLETKDIEEIVLVGGQTRMPKIQEELKNLFGKEPHKEMNPDEVVAIGAAIEGGILGGDVKEVLLLDVTPLSLGIETYGQVNTVLIQKNTTVPTDKSQVFSTAADNQNSVEVHVLQGERPMANDNKTLGRFILDGIPPAPRGIPQIEVTFDIDANGILNVTAKDKATSKTQSIKIEGSTGLSKEEVEKMKKDAEAHAVEDQKKKELIETKNVAENLVYTTEKTLKDAGDKVSGDVKKDVEDKMEALKKIKDSDNIDDIKQKTQELSAVIQKVGAEMYKQSPGQATPQQGPQPGSQDANPQGGEPQDNNNPPTGGPEEGEYKEK